MKYTPGPWWACCSADDAHSHYVFAHEGDAAICRMFQNDPDDDDQKYEPLEGIVTHAERQANARLIAAAPDMYEALKAVAPILAVACCNQQWEREAIRAEQAAIAKAEGKTDVS